MKLNPSLFSPELILGHLLHNGNPPDEDYRKSTKSSLSENKFSFGMGVAAAVFVHLGVILFGGVVFLNHGKDHGTLQQVELLSEDDIATEKDKMKELEPEEEIETEEAPPDAEEVIKSMELSAAVNSPELEAVSLSAIEAALSGAGGSGDFASMMDFSSGGRIGGVGKGGALSESLEDAFSLEEIDQKPRAVFQAAPVYPSGMGSTEGVVSVLFIVDPSGKVTNPRVERSSNPAFEKPALDAVKQWKFEPAVKSGQRVNCKMRVPIRFQPRG